MSISDVQVTIGSSSNDLGTLIRDGNVNKWAKYKPVIHTNLFASSTPVNEWWKGTNLNCGIRIESLSGYSDLESLKADVQNNALEDWIYERPAGGIAAPFRLADFNGYYHGAVAPIALYGLQDNIWISGSNVFSLTYSMNYNDEKSLTLSDLKIRNSDSFNSLYFGVFMTSQGYTFCVTHDVPFELISNYDLITVSVTGFKDAMSGSYTIVPVFSNFPHSISGPFNGKIFPIPFIKSVRLIRSESYATEVSIQAFFLKGNYYVIYYAITIYNGSAVTQTTTPIVTIRSNDSDDIIFTVPIGNPITILPGKVYYSGYLQAMIAPTTWDFVTDMNHIHIRIDTSISGTKIYSINAIERRDTMPVD